MGLDTPPPDWALVDERELEWFFTADNEAVARAALTELRRRHNDTLSDRAVRQRCGNIERAKADLRQLDLRLWEQRLRYRQQAGDWVAWATAHLDVILIDWA